MGPGALRPPRPEVKVHKTDEDVGYGTHGTQNTQDGMYSMQYRWWYAIRAHPRHGMYVEHTASWFVGLHAACKVAHMRLCSQDRWVLMTDKQAGRQIP